MAFDLSKAAFGIASVSNLDKLKKIPLTKIDGNRDNFYSIDDIDELAASIKMVGLMSPVTVVPNGNRYKLISGHRRFEAYKHLCEDALFNGQAVTDFETIPALVVTGLDDLTETVALITANSTARELTYAEKCQQEKALREALLAMKEAGREIPRNLGQYIADQLGTSRNEVSRMHSVNENLGPEAMERLKAGELTAQQAYELSREQKPAQESAAGETKRPVSALDAKQRAALRRFFDQHGDQLAEYALRFSGGLKSDAINGLKNGLCNSGGCADDLGWSGLRSFINFRSYNGYFDSFSTTYSELYSDFAKYAIDKLRGSPDPLDAPGMWQTGSPAVDGQYVCRLRWTPAAESLTTRVMYLIDGAWSLNQSRATAVDDAVEIVSWIRLPECRPAKNASAMAEQWGTNIRDGLAAGLADGRKPETFKGGG